ncbi:Na+/H+ antiporter NhaA [Litorivicinus sp.]|nr:Na+/H+ antiporter NhaA [Litorivicinus sp.]
MNSPNQNLGPLKKIKAVLHSEVGPGILLVIMAVLAMTIMNSPLASHYENVFSTKVVFGVGPIVIDKPFLLWVNDGLMAIFFFLIGLEIKRELMVGHLSDIRQALLPLGAAVGGMAAPALIYLIVTQGVDGAGNGWAIPAATDIAFAIGVLALLGPRVPVSLKVFLLTLAVADDLGAIVIIALFYTEQLSIGSLGVAFAALGILILMNYSNVGNKSAYLFVGFIMWVAVLKSGVHATLAGVALGFCIPYTIPKQESSPVVKLEHELHGFSSYIVLPLFAFANAGVAIGEQGLAILGHEVPIGIAAGLFFGKPIGVMLCCFLILKFDIAQMPRHVNWGQLFGVSLLCGIGFTMSLFIGSLAFGGMGNPLAGLDRLGILTGSILSAVVGFFVLKKALPERLFCVLGSKPLS